jgi:MEMO1 family protein
MKYALFAFLLLSLSVMKSQSQQTGDRVPYAAGSFYPASAESLHINLRQLFSGLGNTQPHRGVRAIIVPHAGYVYSGKVAASGFVSVPPDMKFSNIFLIGSSHRTSFNGASVYNTGDYITPLGTVRVNLDIAAKLITGSRYFTFRPEAHLQEHSLEVQLPFIQYHFKNIPRIVPVIIGTGDTKTIKAIADALRPWFTSDNLFVISSDFSHYPSYSDAIKVDMETAEAILSGSPDKLIASVIKHNPSDVEGLVTSMCGWASGLTLMYLTSGNTDLTYSHIMYLNSGDSRYGDKNGVVGYHSFVVKEKTEEKRQTYFTEDEVKQLFLIARKSIMAELSGEEIYQPDHKSIPKTLFMPAGAFVTLNINNQLRGCIGKIVSADPLCNVVAEMAFAAAYEDPRFPPLTLPEFTEVDLEISVLTPLRKINNISEIEVGRHGIYIRKAGKSGVLLPQVASERGWSVTEFLEHTADDKAGLGRDGWRDADIFIFEAIVLHERKQE